MGRVCWSELIRNSRTMSRLIWFHVPPLHSQKTAAEIASRKLERTREEQLRVMEEKQRALDLIEGYIYFFLLIDS
jgi:ion channel-forming bestrophin family protein